MEIILSKNFTLTRGDIPGTCTLVENINDQIFFTKNRDLLEVLGSIFHTVTFINLNKIDGYPVEFVSDIVIAEAFNKIKFDHIAEVTQVGCGVGMASYSDVYCGTIIKRSKDGKRLKVRMGQAKLINGFDSGEPDALTCDVGGFCGHVEGRQRYEMSDDPNGSVYEFSYRPKSGYFVQKGSKGPFTGGFRLILGGMVHKHDYNF